jgi:hypothetical protein
MRIRPLSQSRRCRRLGVALVLLVSPCVLPAQIVTDARVNLRRTPSTSQAPIRVLARGVELSFVDDDTTVTNGFYRVVTPDDERGWISAEYVSWLEDAASALLGAAIGTRVVGLDDPAPAIDPDWERSPRRGVVMRHEDGSSCSSRGADGGDWETFVLKNRVDVPPVSHAVRWTALRGLPFEDGAGVKKDRPGWTPEQRSAIARVEGVPVTVTGFLAAVRPQAGNREGTNCGWNGEANTDWHVALTERDSDPESRAMVVEPTPRFKRKALGWTTAALRDYVGDRRDRTDSVRVTGFLFYDPDHRNHIVGVGNPKKRYRYTMWELHPVIRIELFRDGAWVDIREEAP